MDNIPFLHLLSMKSTFLLKLNLYLDWERSTLKSCIDMTPLRVKVPQYSDLAQCEGVNPLLIKVL